MKYFDYRIRIRYSDTDQMGVVYYANYLNFMEIGRTEFLRSFGITYKQIEEKDFYLPVVEANCKYKKPALYDDLILVRSMLIYIKKSSVKFEYTIKNETDDSLIALGFTTHATTNKSGKVIPFPEDVKNLILED